eukprot:scaffold60430_cov32-Prasinocladus_malaysianus.AAC.1
MHVACDSYRGMHIDNAVPHSGKLPYFSFAYSLFGAGSFLGHQSGRRHPKAVSVPLGPCRLGPFCGSGIRAPASRGKVRVLGIIHLA